MSKFTQVEKDAQVAALQTILAKVQLIDAEPAVNPLQATVDTLTSQLAVMTTSRDNAVTLSNSLAAKIAAAAAALA